MGASFWLNDKALWIAKPGHVTVSIKLLHLRFSLLLSHFQPIFVSFVAVSAVLSCMLFFQGLIRITLTGPQWFVNADHLGGLSD